MASPKPTPKPKIVTKVSPSQKAWALQQKAANAQFEVAQAARAKKAGAAQNLAFQRRANVSNNSKAPTPNPAAKNKPGAGFGGVTRTTTSSNPSKNPIEKLLTPGSGGIANAMTGGLNRKGGALRVR